MRSLLARFVVGSFIVALLSVCKTAVAQQQPTSRPANAAAELLNSADKEIVAETPGYSGNRFPDYPPFGPAWDKAASDAWVRNAKARQLAHEACKFPVADWGDAPGGPHTGFAPCRSLAANLNDAALYQHLNGDDAGAIETIRDDLHMAKLVGTQPPSQDIIPLLVQMGIEIDACYSLQIIASGINISKDAANSHAVSIGVAHELINDLITAQKSPEDAIKPFQDKNGHLGGETEDHEQKLRTSFLRAYKNFNAHKSFCALSLALHVFYFDNNHWPASLDELVPGYLPRVPLDPFGDDKQAFGYVVLKHALPDGNDRPLLYDRRESANGLFFRTDEPLYGQVKTVGGDFRDVVTWTPKSPATLPATQPLP